MARRKVTKSRKDKLGNITHLCNPFEFWSPRTAKDVIEDIEVRLHSCLAIQNNLTING